MMYNQEQPQPSESDKSNANKTLAPQEKAEEEQFGLSIFEVLKCRVSNTSLKNDFM